MICLCSFDDDVVIMMCCFSLANFFIPTAGVQPGKEQSFDQVIFTELERQDAIKLIADYNSEGQKKYKKIAKQYHKRELKTKQRKGKRGLSTSAPKHGDLTRFWNT